MFGLQSNFTVKEGRFRGLHLNQRVFIQLIGTVAQSDNQIMVLLGTFLREFFF
jgi:hypothetical protein